MDEPVKPIQPSLPVSAAVSAPVAQDLEPEDATRISLAVLAGVAGFVMGGSAMAIVLLWSS